LLAKTCDDRFHAYTALQEVEVEVEVEVEIKDNMVTGCSSRVC